MCTHIHAAYLRNFVNQTSMLISAIPHSTQQQQRQLRSSATKTQVQMGSHRGMNTQIFISKSTSSKTKVSAVRLSCTRLQNSCHGASVSEVPLTHACPCWARTCLFRSHFKCYSPYYMLHKAKEKSRTRNFWNHLLKTLSSQVTESFNVLGHAFN